MIKCCVDGSNEQCTLSKAQEIMEQIGDLINEKKRECDQLNRIIQIQNSLEGELFVICFPLFFEWLWITILR